MRRVGEAVRLLTAIVMADIVGSSTTLVHTGVGAALTERARLATIAADAAARIGGQIVADEGDAAVAASRSVVSAVRIAEAILSSTAEEAFDVRIGLTVGELGLGPEGGFERPEEDILARVAAIQSAGRIGEVTLDDSCRRALLGVSGCQLQSVGDLHCVVELQVDADVGTELGVAMLTEFSGPPGSVAAVAKSTGAMIASASPDSGPHGSGSFAVFESCRTAIELAAQVHQAVATLNIEGQRPPLEASISLAMGEVAVGVDDRFGRPVVEAARMLAHSDGGTAISGDVRSLTDAAFTEPVVVVGNFTLKGLSEPVVIHRVAPRPAAPLLAIPPALARRQRFAFVGRDDELASLSERWAEVVDGGLAGAVVTGDEGAGKTRLIAELANRVGGLGATVLFGACDEHHRQPYLPVTDALAAAATLDPLIVEAVNGRGLMASAFGKGAPKGVKADQIDVFDAVSSAVVRLAHRRPLLLVIDDVQWAAPETVQLIEHVLARADGRSIMIVATCRTEDLRRDHPVRALLSSSKTAHRVAQQRVGRLAEHDVVALLEARAERILDAEERALASAITDVTGGSPLFVEELLVHLSTAGVLAYDGSWRLVVDVGQLPLPESILELMHHRIERLGPEAAHLVAVGAVVGSSFEPSVVAAAAELPLRAVVDGLDAAAVAGVLRTESLTGFYRFGDEVTRQAALRFVGAGRRALLHESIAQKLESDDLDAPDVLAYHWEAAGGANGMRRAVDHLLGAADRDMAAAAWESAIARLRRSVDLLDRLDDHDDRIRGEVHHRLGASLRMIGDETHRPDLVVAADCARRRGDASLMARCALAMMRPGAWYPEAGIVDDQITAMCEDALILLGRDDQLRPQVLATLATNLSYDSDTERRWHLVRQAQASAEQFDDPRSIGVAAAAELIACQEPDLIERRWELAREVQGIGRATSDRELSFTGGFFVMLEHLARGDVEDVVEMSRELTRLADDMGGYWPRFLAGHIATLLAVARSVPEARDVIEAERSKFEHQPVDTLGVSVIQQAGVAMAEGTLSEMLLPFARAADKYREIDEWAKKWNFAFAVAHLEAGDLDAARSMIDAYPEPDLDRYWLPSMCQLGRLGLALGREEYCQRVLRELEPYRNRFAIIGVGAAITGQVSTALGQASLGMGDALSAVSYFREAAVQAAQAGFPYFEVVARRFLATALLQADVDHDEAALLLDQVSESAIRFGFTIEAEEAETLRTLMKSA